MARTAADTAKHLVRILQQGGVAAANLTKTLTGGHKKMTAELTALADDGGKQAALLTYVRDKMSTLSAEARAQLSKDALASSEYQAASTQAYLDTILDEETEEGVMAEAFDTSSGFVNDSFNKPLGKQNISVDDLFTGMMTGMQNKVSNITRRAFQEGQTVKEIASNIREDMSDPAIDRDIRRKSEALARTSIAKVANETRMEGFKANSDVVDRVIFTATLDARTTDICMLTDGTMWPLIGKSYDKLLEEERTEEQLIAESKAKTEAAKTGVAGGRPVAMSSRAPAETAKWMDTSVFNDDYKDMVDRVGIPKPIKNDPNESAFYSDGKIHMSTFDANSLLGQTTYRHELGHMMEEKNSAFTGGTAIDPKFNKLREEEGAALVAKQVASFEKIKKQYPELKDKEYSHNNMLIAMDIDFAHRVDDLYANYGSFDDPNSLSGKELNDDSAWLYAEDHLPEGSLAKDIFNLKDYDSEYASTMSNTGTALRLAQAQEFGVWDDFLMNENTKNGKHTFGASWADAGMSSDLISALTKNEMGHGHSNEYYDTRITKETRPGNYENITDFSKREWNKLPGKELKWGQNTETFANAFTLFYDDGSYSSKVNRRLLQELSPGLFDYMEELTTNGGKNP